MDPSKPGTIGPYMNDPDQINNKKQQADAMVRSHDVIRKVFAEFEALSGRRLHKQNFRRLVETSAIVEATGGGAPGTRETDLLRQREFVLRTLLPRAPAIALARLEPYGLFIILGLLSLGAFYAMYLLVAGRAARGGSARGAGRGALERRGNGLPRGDPGSILPPAGRGPPAAARWAS